MRETNAARLIAYRNELIEGGVPQDVADAMTKEAGFELIHQDGLRVRSAGESAQS